MLDTKGQLRIVSVIPFLVSDVIMRRFYFGATPQNAVSADNVRWDKGVTHTLRWLRFDFCGWQKSFILMIFREVVSSDWSRFSNGKERKRTIANDKTRNRCMTSSCCLYKVMMTRSISVKERCSMIATWTPSTRSSNPCLPKQAVNRGIIFNQNRWRN